MIDWGRILLPGGQGATQARELGELRYGRPAQYPQHRSTILGLPVVPTQDKGNAGMDGVPDDDPRVQDAIRAATRWELAQSSVQNVDQWTPWAFQVWSPQGRGGASGHLHPRESGGLVGVFSSVNDPIGAVDGLLHEAAHQRLHALGIDLEAHDTELLHTSTERNLFSPIRRDILRPYSAVLHGILAWAYMLENELAQGPAGLPYLEQNTAKVRMGLYVLERNLKASREGQLMVEGFLEWGHDVEGRASAALAAAGVAQQPVPDAPQELRDATNA